MNYLQRKLFAVPAALAFALVYLALKGNPFRLDLAVCASYTVGLFINVKRRRGNTGLLTGDHAIPLVELILGHILALAVIVGIVRLGIYTAPVLPKWLTAPLGTSPSGRPLPAPLGYLQTGMVFLVGFIESWWLSTVTTPEEKEARSRVIVSNDTYEEYLSDRLRIRPRSGR